MNILSADDSLLLIIDVQEKLVAMLEKDIIVSKAVKVAGAAKILGIPTIVTEQYPKGLGATVEPLKTVLAEDTEIVEKTAFNALLVEGMIEKIKSFGKKQVVLFGIETHICVHQTAAALLEEGYDVYVIKDACASRSKYEFKMGIDAMKANGAKISCVEITLFEWLKSAKNPNFKEVQALIK
ncbi:MAG: isochorismatase family protein [Candidatus Gastranaerophilales bacterium]